MLGTWLWEGLPDAWCIKAGCHKITADPTNREYLTFIRKKINMLLSPGGYDADGFKIDQLAM